MSNSSIPCNLWLPNTKYLCPDEIISSDDKLFCNNFLLLRTETTNKENIKIRIIIVFFID
jgi:hypothetical protein